MADCPEEAHLARYAAGVCASDEASEIKKHVERCSRCAQWVQEAEADEAILGRVRAVLDDNAQQAEAAGQPESAQRRNEGALPSEEGRPQVLPQVFEGYETLRELSRGGQGVVYQAIQKSTKRKVAIKVLLEGPHASETKRKRFEREIDLAAQLRHDNIVVVFDSGITTDGRPFYVMDYVRGRPLHLHVHENKLPLERTLELFAAVCDAVQFAHQRGVIHRDLKPSNVLVDAEGRPRILDFGLAKSLSAPIDTLVSITQDVMGTLPYMSPEQARGNPDEINACTDVYALGVILYELLTGEYPYPVVGQMADVLRHITDTPPTPPTRKWTPETGVARRSTGRLRRSHCPIDDDVQTIALKCLSKERQRRYQSPGELAKDIRHYLAGEPIEAKRDSGWYVLKKTMRCYRWPVMFSTTVVILIMLSVVVLAVLYRRAVAAERIAAQQYAAAERERAKAEHINQGLRLVSRAFVWRELVGQHSTESEDVWRSLRSYVVGAVHSQPAAFTSLPEIRRLADELGASHSINASPESVRCVPLVAIQRHSEAQSFAWLNWEEMPLYVGDRLQCVVASTRPMYFRIYSLDQDGRVARLFPLDGEANEATILLYAPDVSSEEWWTVDRPTGRNTLFVLGSLDPPCIDSAFEERVRGLGHNAGMAQNAYYSLHGNPRTDHRQDHYWVRAGSDLAFDCDCLALFSYPIVSPAEHN